jgi:hypothetical protein
LFAEPAIQFPLAAAERQLSAANAQTRYQGLLRSQLPGPWLRCARGELWLIDDRGRSPKPMLECTLGEQRPHLDGKLEDPIWSQAARVTLRSTLLDDAAWPADVLLAHDGQFLYLAARCVRAPGAEYSGSSAPRTRDEELRGNDRLDLLIDVDRDFVSYFQFTVDCRGLARDACFGDEQWDPAWYIASRNGPDAWVLEVAIPLDELAMRAPDRGDAWGLGLQRIVPGVGFQSWCEPAAVRVAPEGFGYLVFE